MGANFSGGGATVFHDRTDAPGEIIRELVNSTDGQGLHFNGSSGNIDIASPPNLGTKFSFEFIVQADAWGAAEHGLVDFGTGGRFYFYASSGTSYNLAVYSVAGASSFGVKVLDDLKVHHLVLTIDGTSAILYDNGNQVGTATITSPNIDSCSDARIGSDYAGTGGLFNGTLYRTRFWNKTLTSAEVTATYENATVPFADQYGSQSEVMPNATDRNFSGANNWVNVDLSAFNSTDDLTVSSTGGAQECRLAEYGAPMIGGKRYRVTVTASALSGDGFTLRDFDNVVLAKAGTLYRNGVYVSNDTLQLADGSNVFEFVYAGALGASNGGLMVRSDGTGSITCADFSVRKIGCAVDVDCAFSNPTQSLLVQDRAGNADGTSSATGVTQVTPIEQLNSKSARIGTSAATPGDGELIAHQLYINGTYLQLSDGATQTGLIGPGSKVSGLTASDLAIRAQGKLEFITNNAWATPAATIDSAGLSTFAADGSGSAMTVTQSGTGPALVVSPTDGLAGRVGFGIAAPSATVHIKNAADDTTNELLCLQATDAYSDLIMTDTSGSIKLRTNSKALKVYTGGDASSTNANGSALALTISSTGLTTVKNPGWPLKNELTNSGFDVWSNSTLEDVGSELVTNGTFDSNTTGWTDASTGSGSIAHATNLMNVVGSGLSDRGKARQQVSGLTVGKLYKFVFTAAGSNNEAFRLDDTAFGGTDYSPTSWGSSVNPGDGTYTVVFEAKTTNFFIELEEVDATMTIDTVTLKEVTPGIVTGAKGPDGWQGTSSMNMFREHSGGNTKTGAFYSCKTVTAATARFMHPSDQTSDAWLGKVRGRTMTMGFWAKTSTANHVRIGWYDDGYTYSDYCPNDGDWHWLELTETVGTGSNTVSPVIRFEATGATAYISQPMLVFGSAIGAGNYSAPSGETIYFEGTSVSNKFSGKTGFSDIGITTMNAEADSNGKIPKGAKAIMFKLAGNDSGSSGDDPAFQTGGLSSLNGMSNDLGGMPNDMRKMDSGWTACDANGDYDYFLDASGSGTFDFYYGYNYIGVQLR